MSDITGTQFWEQFLNLLGDTTSVRSYYLPQSGEGIDGQFAQEGEYANVIATLFQRTEPESSERQQAVELLNDAGFWKSTDDLSFWVAFDGNERDLLSLKSAAEERLPNLFDATDAGTGTAETAPEDLGLGVGGVAGGEGGATTVPGILSGGTLTRIVRQGREDLWGITYTVQDIEHVYTFDSLEAMEAALGQDAVTSGTYGFMTLDESDVNDGDTWLLGDAAAFVGQEGSYSAYFDDVMREAALEAGVRNPGMVGEFLSQPDIQRIMAEGEAGGWSAPRIQAEVRNTDYYQNTLYPGISNFLTAGSTNPEAEYLRYVSGVDSSLEMLGYERDANGTYRSVAGDMLDRGITVSKFNSFAPTFVRAEQSQEFASTLNKWTEQDLGVSITFDDWFDVLDGNSAPDIAQVVEKATLSFTAQNVGTTLDDATITRLANLTDLSETQMRTAFTSAEEALLAVGAVDLARFGLTQEALISSAFGVESTGADPLSTDGTAFTATEIRKRARKAARELGLQDDRQAQFFVGFNAGGRPIRTGLSAGAPEAG